MLDTSSLIKEGNEKSIHGLRNLEKSWKNIGQLREETLAQLKKTDGEAYWQLLVKPHSQIMTLKYFMDSIQKMQPLLHEAIFTGQMKTQFGKPSQVQPMSDICEQKSKAGSNISSGMIIS